MEKVVSGIRGVGKIAKQTVQLTMEGATELAQKANRQNVADTVMKGRHAVITTFGKTRPTKDVGFEVKHRSANQSLVVLSEIYKEVNLFVKYCSAVADRYEAVVTLIERFRTACDGYILAETTEASAMVGEGGESDDDDCIIVDLDTAGSPKSPGLGVSPETNNGSFSGGARPKAGRCVYNLEDERLRSEKAQVILNAVQEMRAATTEMQETIQGSCMQLLTSTMRTLEGEDRRLFAEVEKSSMEYDLLRDQVAKLRRDVEKLSDTVQRPSGIQQAALPPQVFDAVRDEYHAKAERLEALNRDLEAKGSELRQVTGDARAALLFTLEQTSMASWSCFNILFHQLQRFFGDISRLSGPATKAMIEMKGMQTVARAIDKDRKKALKDARDEGERRVAAASGITLGSTPPPPTPDAEAEGGGKLKNFDELFDQYLFSSAPPQPASASGLDRAHRAEPEKAQPPNRAPTGSGTVPGSASVTGEHEAVDFFGA